MSEVTVIENMPEEEYHTVEAFSPTGAQQMQVSPLHYWLQTPWLNKEQNKPEPTQAQTDGKAFHARVVEGPQAFHDRFYTEIKKDDHPNALDKWDDLKEMCRDQGLPVGGTKGKLIARLKEKLPNIEIWDDIVTQHKEANKDKSEISAETALRIARTATALESHSVVGKAFKGGQPEVSIFWEDPEFGVPMKSRLDYKKTTFPVDLKTFANSMGKPVEKAVSMAVANYFYNVGAVFHMEAFERAFGGCTGLLFVFVEKSDWPNILAREFLRYRSDGTGHENAYYTAGHARFRQAVRTWAECSQRYVGEGEPWVEIPPVRAFDDMDFPLYMMD